MRTCSTSVGVAIAAAAIIGSSSPALAATTASGGAKITVIEASPVSASGVKKAKKVKYPQGVDAQTSVGTLVEADGTAHILTAGELAAGRYIASPDEASVMYVTRWGWVTGTIYFNKKETANMARAGYVAWFATFLPVPFNVLVGGAVTWVAGVASLANHRNQCLAIKSTPYPYTCTGKWCF